MQTQFKLTPEEAKHAVEAYVAKAQRNKGLKVTAVTHDADGSVTVSAEVTVKAPVPRKPRAAKAAVAAAPEPAKAAKRA